MASYDEPLKSLLHQLKYKHVKDIGKLCGQLLYLTTNYPDCDVITCTPLHKNRQADRGYNQAQVIAQEFSKCSGIPFLVLLSKGVATASQATLIDKSQRLHNLESVFSINRKYSALQKKPAKVILIDDVITTGATLNACAQVLKDWGCKEVYGLGVAHGF